MCLQICTHTHMNRRGDRGKNCTGTCNTHHIPCRRQGEGIKGISQKCNMSTSTEWPLDGWMRPAASLSLNRSNPCLPAAQLTDPPDPSVTTMIFLPKRCYIKKNKISKGIWKNFFISVLTPIFPLYKKAWTWGDVQISVLSIAWELCVYIKLYLN